jgi:OOP family OmpA-OmpF porin
MKKFIAALLLGSMAGAAAAAESAPATYFDIMGSYLLAPGSEHNPKLDKGYGLDLRYGSGMTLLGLPIEFRAFYDQLKPKAAAAGDRTRYGLGADAVFAFDNMFSVTPYVLGGGGAVYSDDTPTLKKKLGFGIDVGGGILTGALISSWRLRGELRYTYEKVDKAATDLSAHVGLEMPFGEATPPPAREKPVRVVETPVVMAPIADSDGDAVADGNDKCPDTPKGEMVDASGCTVKEVVALKGVTFEVNSDQLTPESMPLLDETARTLNGKYAASNVEIAGHTDATGNDAYNLDLSRRRAESVRQYLIQQGVKAEHLSAAGYGETQPIADNATREGRATNRRVELRIKQ